MPHIAISGNQMKAQAWLLNLAAITAGAIALAF